MGVNPAISVIVPCYNLEQYILECLNSLKTQSFKDFEVIIVDDGSMDSSRKIIRNFLESAGERFCLIEKSNGGVSSARNAGLHVSKGEYVTFVDGDDWVAVDYLNNLYKCAVNSGADLCVSPMGAFTSKGDKCVVGEFTYLEMKTKRDCLFGIDKMKFLFQSPCCKLYKNEIIGSKSLEFDERLAISEDLSFNLDYYSNVNICTLSPQCGYNRRVRDDSLSHKVTLPTKQKWVLDHFLAFFEEIKSEISSTQLLRMSSVFTEWLWSYGFIMKIQSAVLEKNRDELYSNLNSQIKTDIVRYYRPQSRKDKIFFFCVKNDSICILRFLVQTKYWLLQNDRLYNFVKRIMLR